MRNYISMGRPACIVCHQNVEKPDFCFHICSGQGGDGTYSGFTVHLTCARNLDQLDSRNFTAHKAAMVFNMLNEGD